MTLLNREINVGTCVTLFVICKTKSVLHLIRISDNCTNDGIVIVVQYLSKFGTNFEKKYTHFVCFTC